MYDNNIALSEEPPQGLHVPVQEKPDWRTHNVIVLDPADAEEFYLKLQEVRDALPEEHKHYLKKDRELADLLDRNTQLVGIKDEFGRLVAGALVVMPVPRAVVRKYIDYPWYAQSDQSALLSALWTDGNHAGKGYATAVVGKIIEMAHNRKDILQIFAGVAEGNGVRRVFEDTHHFYLKASKISSDHGKPMNYFVLDVRYPL